MPIMRRYKCSYKAPFFLLPPLELSYLAGITKCKIGVQYRFHDYIVDRQGINHFVNDVEVFNPDLIVTIVGVESIDDDLYKIKQLKERVNAKVLVMGYLPSIYPEFYLKNHLIDFILLNEPEETYSELLYYLIEDNKEKLSNLDGLALIINNEIKINPWRERIKYLDNIPMPDRESLINNNYSEPYLGRPFTTMIYSRGCPFQCNYCVKTYGDKIVYHSPKRMVEELKYAVNSLNIKYVRFMDDTFTTNKTKVLDLCNEIIKEGLIFQWVCLSRADTMDEEIALRMREAGCKRVYLGIESASKKVLEFYNKKCEIVDIVETVNKLKKCNIEIFGFLMTGALNETNKDFIETINFVKRLKLDFVVLDLLMPYPGTELHTKMQSEINFSLNPYTLEYKDPNWLENMKQREALFYKSFYLDIYQIKKRLSYFLRFPKDSFSACRSMIMHLIQKKDKKNNKFI